MRAAMGVTVVFDPFVEREFQRFARKLETDPLMVLFAKWRREAAIDALKRQPGVTEVVPSGSMARGTHMRRIHDVDLIVVFDDDAYVEWHGPGSADVALEHVQGMIAEALQGGPFSLVHDTDKRNHVVKANLEPSWGPLLDAIVPSAPPMDVMPAIREGTHLRIPERLNPRLRKDPWIAADPEKFMRMVAARQRQWSNFDKVVRMIKVWADDRDLGLSRLGVEVLVLKYLPRPGIFETLSCSDAIAGFFEAAAENIKQDKLVDPAGHCGEIIEDLNYDKLQAALADSAETARKAVNAERKWADRRSAIEAVTHPSVYWQKIFGKANIDRPRDWSYSPWFPETRPEPESRRWFDERAEPRDKAWTWTGHTSGRRAGDTPGPTRPSKATREHARTAYDGPPPASRPADRPDAGFRRPDRPNAGVPGTGAAAGNPREAAAKDSLGGTLSSRPGTGTPRGATIFGMG